MTYAPQALLALRHYLKPHTGLSDVALGIVGDEDHDGGYHHGWDNRSSNSDYSWAESSRDSSHRSNAARAIDIGMFARLRELSVWLVEQCKANAPDTRDIREVIYSPDGRTVKRWDRLGRRTSGDSSHLTHTHISWFADAEGRDKTAVFKRFFEGGAMATAEDRYPRNTDQYLWETIREQDPIKGITLGDGTQTTLPNLPLQRAKRIEDKIDALKVPAPAPVDPAVVAKAVMDAVLHPDVLLAIAKAVNDDAHQRLAG